MENYSHYTSKDFLNDDRFKKWVLSQGRQHAAHWSEVIAYNPGKSNEIALAKAILLGLDENLESPEKGRKDQIWAAVQISNEENDRKTLFTATWNIKRWEYAAAILLVIIGLAWSVQTDRSSPQRTPSALQMELDPAWNEKKNQTQVKQLVALEDGSSVTLQPGSVLRYTNFNNDFRTVYLEGEGYFEVTKNSQKPFLVYARDIIVKVIGTSFHVKAGKGTQKNQVSVTSGKVQVFIASAETNTNDPRNSIFLTPNQQVILDNQSKIIKKGLVDSPIELSSSAIKYNFDLLASGAFWF